MAYRNRSTRRLARKSRQRFFTTLIIIVLLFYVLFTWVLPFFINGVGTVTNIFKGNKPLETSISENPNLAPPVLNIPYEATSSAKIDIQGFATANSTVKIYLDDELVQEVTSDDNGTFRAKSIMLVLGTNNIYGKTEDEKGKESLPSKTIKLIYDSEKPTLEVSSPTDGQTFTGERKINVTGKSEPSVTVTINGEQAILDSEGKFSKIFNLSDGSNTITIVSRDAAGNETSLSRNVTFNP